MSSRMLGYSLLLVLIATFAVPMLAPTQQPAANPANVIKWEYRVAKLDANACSVDNEVNTLLNSFGQQGWDLVSYERAAPPFPRDAEGSLLIKPAATGPNKDINPPTADAFQGSIAMRWTQAPPGGCRMLFKRVWHPPAPQ